METNQLKQLILNAKIPLVLKNHSKSDFCSWPMEKWTKTFGPELLDFRCGKMAFTKEPQWDKNCTTKKATFEDFLKNASDDEFWYFDYKHLCQWLKNNETLRKEINWADFGFPELKADQSTIWAGSKGAHTPCHQDTYGTNAVLQLRGRKLWLLWPPDAPDLKPTRNPFEESSVFSKLNFFSPDFEASGGCFKVILSPGDCLIVPHKWWHYVENLECSISVNAWLPHCQDDFERVKEAVATVLVQKFRPNEALIGPIEALRIIESLKNRDFPLNSNTNVDFTEFENIFPVNWLNKSEFNEFLKNQKSRFNSGRNGEASFSDDFLDAILSDDVLELVARKLINK